MGGLLFVSQAMLDVWAEQGKIDLVGNAIMLMAGEGKGRSYALEPAVRFLEVLGTEQDPNGLLRKVKSLAQLKEMGAEAVDDSVVLGDAGYEVEPGFLAEVSALQAAAAAVQAPAAPRPAPAPPRTPAPPVARPAGARSIGTSPLPKDLEERRKEAEALARFLLENLS
jgi:hypothetical protein